MSRGVNELWKIDTFNSGDNDDYYEYIVVINYFTLVWPVRNHGHYRRRGCSVGDKEKEKAHF